MSEKSGPETLRRSLKEQEAQKKSPAQRVGEQIASRERWLKRVRRSLHRVDNVDYDTHLASQNPQPEQVLASPTPVGEPTEAAEGVVADQVIERQAAIAKKGRTSK